MHEDGRFPAKCFIEIDMLGRRGHPVIAADHVGNFHQLVVDDSGEMIGGETIRF